MFGLNPLANITLGDISSDFSLHVSPPKPLLEILIHFSTGRMNGELRTMGFIKDNRDEVSSSIRMNGLETRIIYRFLQTVVEANSGDGKKYQEGL